MTVIAMTREIGSHGSEVAAGVAAALRLEIINSEIVVPHVAGSLGVEQSAVQRYLEGKASLFDRWQIDTRKLSQHTLDQILVTTQVSLSRALEFGDEPFWVCGEGVEHIPTLFFRR
jgi:Cytidylate kinase-like family